jgi:hypothetical protein
MGSKKKERGKGLGERKRREKKRERVDKVRDDIQVKCGMVEGKGKGIGKEKGLEGGN